MGQEVANREKGSTSTRNNKRKKYDVFISYRRTSSQSKIEGYRHTTSVARALALELEAEGYRVFVDVRSISNKPKDCKIKLKQSEYAIVLLADYSFEEGGGDNFREELDYILHEMEEEKNYWVNLDGRFDRNVQGNDDELIKEVKERTTTKMDTNRKRLIDDIPLEKIKKSRLSHKTIKKMSLSFGMLLIVALSALGVLVNKIIQPEIIFIGGGSTKNFLEKEKLKCKDITHRIPNSKYIHIPSGDAAAVLLDLRNDSGAASYTPIIFSTGKMIVKDPVVKRTFMADKRIFELYVGSAPLQVQVMNYSGPFQDGDKITADTLLAWLKDTHNYIYKTSDNSGTFRQYKENLEKDSTFKFQNVHNMRDFNQTIADGVDSEFNDGGLKIFLGNEYYFYEVDKSLRRFKVSTTMNDTIWEVPLYIYAASEKNGNSMKTTYPMSKVVYRILQQFGLDTLYEKNGYKRKNSDEIFISLPHTKSPREHK